MAGDWIKIRKCLPNDPRIVRMASALRADRFRTLGGTVSAWCLFDEHTDTGRLEGYTPELLDEVVGFPGLAAAMAAVGWLEVGDGFLVAPRFEKHNGQSAKRRCQETERKRSARDADKKRTREEKRREENEDTTTAAERLCLAHPHKALTQPALKAALAALKRHPFETILAGTQAYATAVKGWTDGERLQFVKNPEAFFTEDIWNQPAENWRSRTAARRDGGRRPEPVLDLGGRRPSAIVSIPQMVPAGQAAGDELDF